MHYTFETRKLYKEKRHELAKNLMELRREKRLKSSLCLIDLRNKKINKLRNDLLELEALIGRIVFKIK
jgi:hypothetical protein